MGVEIRETLRGRDFLDISDLEPDQLRGLLDLARRIKSGEWLEQPLRGKQVAMLFQKPSMRTRISFEVGIVRLGGHPVIPANSEIGLGERESVPDVARVMSRYVHGIVARLHRHSELVEIAEYASIPVINALTEHSHPCQILADVLTIEEATGRIDGRKVAFVGDGNNVAFSLMQAAGALGFQLSVVTPPAYRPAGDVDNQGVRVTGDLGAVAGADVVYTDVWTSMGQEQEKQSRDRAFSEYQVNRELMDLAPKAVFMHCLPAHRGEEVTADVIDGPGSVVFDQAENRLYVQMALMASVL